MRLLLDEMLGPRLAAQLRDRGFDVATVVERPDLRGQSDETVLQAGAEEHRVVITQNVADLARLHQQWSQSGRQHAGVVVLTGQAFPQSRAFVGQVVAALGAEEALTTAGQLTYLHPPT